MCTYRLRIRPDFLIIGAQKSGTTSLSKYLAQHPDIFIPKGKELHYFDDRYDKWWGLARYLSQFPFNFYSKFKSYGEVTPYYLFHPFAAQRAFNFNPNFKIIIILRNPMDRLISHYKHNVSKGYELEDINRAIELEESRIGDETLSGPGASLTKKHKLFSYLSRGIYYPQIKEWTKYFAKEKVLIVSFKELTETPSELLSRIFIFLKLNPFKVNHRKVFNKSKLNINDEITTKNKSYIYDKIKESNKNVLHEFKIDLDA